MRYIIQDNPSVTVITPSIGSPKLIDCMESVTRQTYENLRHLIVFDGKQETPITYNHTRLDFCRLPYNTGAGGFYGHRIYATFPKLIFTDLIFFLDEDNWYQPNHVESLVNLFQKNDNLEFAYSLREIYSPNKEFLINDNCESLGAYPVWCDENSYLVDTSSYAFRRNFIAKKCHYWDWGWGADRRFFSIAKPFESACSGKHTLCYRLEGNNNSVTEEFFQKGNEIYFEKYRGIYPWIR